MSQLWRAALSNASHSRMSDFPIHIPNKGGNFREAALQFASEIQRVDHICKELKGEKVRSTGWVGGAKTQNRGLLSSPKPHVISVTNRTQKWQLHKKEKYK